MHAAGSSGSASAAARSSSIDPRRSRTAEVSDEHHFIRPGRDAHLLAAIAHTIVAEGLEAPGAHLEEHVNGLDEIGELLSPFDPDAVAPVCGIDAEEIRRMARELAAAESAAVYARIGTTTQEYGTLASWLVDVLNVLTGNLDREGGVMFPLAAAGQSNSVGEPGHGRGAKIGRWSSRVRELPEAYGELPVATLADEIETPGAGQVRALITVAGNPVLSTPNSGRLRGRDRVARLPGLGRLLPERDSEPRRRRHPGADAARAQPLRPRLLPAGGPQHLPFHAGLAADAR